MTQPGIWMQGDFTHPRVTLQEWLWTALLLTELKVASLANITK